MIEQTYKIVSFSEEAQNNVRVGVEKLTDAVKVTMGPSGKNVLIEQPDASPILTKDGVTVARAINLRDRFANLGVQIVREAAQRTAEEAGDGTTTATVLANAIFHEGLRALAAGHELRIIRVKRGSGTARARRLFGVCRGWVRSRRRRTPQMPPTTRTPQTCSSACPI